MSGDTKGNSYIQMNKFVSETIQGRGCCSSPAYTATNDWNSICIDKWYAPNYNIVFYGQMEWDVIRKFCVDTLIVWWGWGAQISWYCNSPYSSWWGWAWWFIEQTVEKEVLGSPYTVAVVVWAWWVRAAWGNSSVFWLTAYWWGFADRNNWGTGWSWAWGRNYWWAWCEWQGCKWWDYSWGWGWAWEDWHNWCNYGGGYAPTETTNRKWWDWKCSCISGELRRYAWWGWGWYDYRGRYGWCWWCWWGWNGWSSVSNCAPTNWSYYWWWWGWAASTESNTWANGGCWYQWVVYIRYKTDWSCWIKCALWWNKYVCWDYTIHEFTTVWSTDFTVYL